MNYQSIDNFLSVQECEMLMSFYHKHFASLGRNYVDRNVLDITTAIDNLYTDTAFNDTDILKKITARITKNILNVDDNCFINYHQLVHWPENSYQPRHIDFDYHTYTSIIYLNDDFSGGQTVVGIQKVNPVQGKIITFQGNKIDHEVLPIRKGNRYTLAVWYKTLI